MILYDSNELGFILRIEGSVIPKALLYTIPSCILTGVSSYIINQYFHEHFQYLKESNQSVLWSAFIIVLSLLLAVRTNKSYDRFWEGITLVQQMRAEWFEAASNLTAFSMVAAKKDAEKLKEVLDFQYILVRLMSLMHGAALCQIGGHKHDFDVLDLQAIDESSFKYLNECESLDVNRVEVILHWIQVLVTEGAADGVITVPPPILTRAYQTLSRGMVNLHNARKLADVPFPFPLSQILIVLIFIFSIITPIFVSTVVEHPAFAVFICFVPVFGMWGITFVAGELEQPFGSDPNDLPLTALQFDFNTTLLMLLDKQVSTAPTIIREKAMPVNALRVALADGDNPLSRTNSKFAGHEDHNEHYNAIGSHRPSAVFSDYSSVEGPNASAHHRSKRARAGKNTHVSALEKRKKRMQQAAWSRTSVVASEESHINSPTTPNPIGHHDSLHSSTEDVASCEEIPDVAYTNKMRDMHRSSSSISASKKPERDMQSLGNISENKINVSMEEKYASGEGMELRTSLEAKAVDCDVQNALLYDSKRWNALLQVSIQTSEAVSQLARHLRNYQILDSEGSSPIAAKKRYLGYGKPRSPRMPNGSPPMETPRLDGLI